MQFVSHCLNLLLLGIDSYCQNILPCQNLPHSNQFKIFVRFVLLKNVIKFTYQRLYTVKINYLFENVSHARSSFFLFKCSFQVFFVFKLIRFGPFWWGWPIPHILKKIGGTTVPQISDIHFRFFAFTRILHHCLRIWDRSEGNLPILGHWFQKSRSLLKKTLFVGLA